MILLYCNQFGNYLLFLVRFRIIFYFFFFFRQFHMLTQTDSTAEMSTKIATPEELQALNLYELLTSLPKTEELVLEGQQGDDGSFTACHVCIRVSRRRLPMVSGSVSVVAVVCSLTVRPHPEASEVIVTGEFDGVSPEIEYTKPKFSYIVHTVVCFTPSCPPR